MKQRHSRHRNATGAPVEPWKTAVAVIAGWWHRASGRFKEAAFPSDRERGDVPGWVMITLMSAILVAALLVVVQPALEQLFDSAMEQVQP